MIGDTCKDCYYVVENPRKLICKKDPPIPVVVHDDIIFVQPMVQPEGWCSKWHEKDI
jgi:hypothetical protein